MNSLIYYPVNVITTRGVVELKDILPGDTVYEFGTDELLTVLDIPTLKRHTLYYVEYTDGRSQILRDCDYVFTGYKNIAIRTAGTIGKYSNIKQPKLDYKRKIEILNPDPYVVGAMLIYGNFNDKYMNIPYDADPIVNLLCCKYHMEYAMDRIGNNKEVHFKYSNSDSMITWDEFFNNRFMYEIIDSYIYSSIDDRIQFAHGVFDVGYKTTMFDSGVGIIHQDLPRTELFQKVLWSLGVLSKIEFIPEKGKYKLSVLGNCIPSIGFSYNINNLEHALTHAHSETTFENSISNITPISYCRANNITGNLLLDKRKALYITDTYLPRVSI